MSTTKTTKGESNVAAKAVAKTVAPKAEVKKEAAPKAEAKATAPKAEVKKEATAKKEATPKAEVKKAPAKKTATTKKTETKKATAPKTEAKKTSAKKTEEVYIEYAGTQVSTADIIAKVVEATGKKASSIKTLNVYVQPEFGLAYYTVDGTEGKITY